MSSEIKNLSTRLKIARKELKLSQEAFGKPVYLRRQDIHAYETEKRQPGIIVLSRLAEEHDISLDWLVLGRGGPFSH